MYSKLRREVNQGWVTVNDINERWLRKEGIKGKGEGRRGGSWSFA